MAGCNDRIIREHNEFAWLAWHIAALQRMKKLPKIEKLMARRGTRQQDAKEQQAIFEAWAMRYNNKRKAKLNG